MEDKSSIWINPENDLSSICANPRLMEKFGQMTHFERDNNVRVAYGRGRDAEKVYPLRAANISNAQKFPDNGGAVYSMFDLVFPEGDHFFSVGYRTDEGAYPRGGLNNIENFEKITFFGKSDFFIIYRLMDLSSLKRKHYRRIKVEKFVEKRIFQNSLYKIRGKKLASLEGKGQQNLQIN